MSKVEISNRGGSWRVAVDGGPNLAPAIVAGGLQVDFPSDADSALVHVTFRATELNMHLDGAVVEATQELLS